MHSFKIQTSGLHPFCWGFLWSNALGVAVEWLSPVRDEMYGKMRPRYTLISKSRSTSKSERRVRSVILFMSVRNLLTGKVWHDFYLLKSCFNPSPGFWAYPPMLLNHTFKVSIRNFLCRST